MSSRKLWVAGLYTLILASSPAAWAQRGAGPPPGIGSAAGLTGTGTGLLAPTAAPAAAASPTTLWSFLGLSGSNLQACKAKLCSSQIGQMLNSMATGPVGAMTGGFIPPLCPPPSAAQIAALQQQPLGGAQAAAAKIQASEAGAKARVAAVEYLGTVDCTRWSEATTALINALRADPNECVRYAAARALNSGCCCNQKTIEALRICVAGEEVGNPAETSARVKAAAFNALQNCLMRVADVVPDENKGIIREGPPDQPKLEPIPRQPLDREKSTMKAGDGTHIAASHVVQNPALNRFEQELRRKTYTQTVNEARQSLFEVARSANVSPTLPPGKKSVFDLLNKARQDVANKARASAPPPPGPVPSDPHVVPSSFTPGSERNQGQGMVVPNPGSGRTS